MSTADLPSGTPTPTATAARRPGRRRALAALAVAATMLALWSGYGPQHVSAASLTTVVAAADATVSSDTPDTNDGTDTALTVRASADPKPEADVYIKFTVSGLTAPPAGASLQIYSNAVSGTGVQLWTAASNWTETGITYHNAPARGATMVADMPNLTAGTWATADVSTVVTGNGTYTFVLTTTSTVSKKFASREVAATPPKLVLNTASAAATVTAASGSGQTAAVGTAFAAPLAATVKDSGGAAVANVPVTFSTPVSGASAAFTGGASAITVNTDASGTATSPALTANATAGTYAVTAASTGAAPASFTLTNGSGGTPTGDVPSTVNAAADATVEADTPDVNDGKDTALTVRAAADPKPEEDAYLKFTVTGLTGPPTSASLQIYSNATSATGVQVWTAGNDWTETGITYNNAPVRGAAPVTDMAHLVESTWASADVGSVVTGNGTYTFVLTTTSTLAKKFASREVAATPPRLVLNAGTGTASPTASASTSASAGPSTTISPTLSPSPTPSPTPSTTATGGTGALSPTGGSGQSAMVGRAFASPLSVKVDGAGSGVTVTFTAPATGATGVFAGGGASATASTDSTGVATSPVLTAGSSSGTYQVIATSSAPSGSAAFSLTNHDPVIAAAGDIACTAGDVPTATACQQQATANLALSLHPDAVLPLGDEQYELGSGSDFATQYGASWGQLAPISFPAPGNHEYGYIGSAIEPTGGTGYFSYFGDAGHPLSPGCTTLCKSWYSYNLGDWHLISLDSQCAVIGGCNPGNPEYQWLLADLNANTRACTLAYWHIPIYSSSQDHQPDMQAIYQLLYTKKADLVLNGHAHFYERFSGQDGAGNADSVNGIPEFIVGTGGRSFFSIRDTPSANSVTRIANTFGVLQLTLSHNAYSFNFVPTNTGGSTDSGSGTCH
ncbi:DNRLRE domain-containing protein [Streptacidiphilus sp. N1-12]|uniref:DNRLRE domain-containing protein n=2 Tax=Streptacidiphilus alkalitolerans TaxID=3342712 RepID=A0ABV6WQ20_9ACTN